MAAVALHAAILVVLWQRPLALLVPPVSGPAEGSSGIAALFEELPDRAEAPAPPSAPVEVAASEPQPSDPTPDTIGPAAPEPSMEVIARVESPGPMIRLPRSREAAAAVAAMEAELSGCRAAAGAPAPREISGPLGPGSGVLKESAEPPAVIQAAPPAPAPLPVSAIVSSDGSRPVSGASGAAGVLRWSLSSGRK